MCLNCYLAVNCSETTPALFLHFSRGVDHCSRKGPTPSLIFTLLSTIHRWTYIPNHWTDWGMIPLAVAGLSSWNDFACWFEVFLLQFWYLCKTIENTLIWLGVQLTTGHHAFWVWQFCSLWNEKIQLDLKLKSCFLWLECVISTTINNSISSPGGYSAGQESLPSCQDTCMENQNCVAVDYNYKDGICWVHEKTTDLNVKNKWNDGNQYVVTSKCAAPPTTSE